MGALMRSTDWSRTVFGPVAGWPQSLRTAISILLESRFAMVVAWGPQFRFFYNDRYRPILGAKHPSALGAPGAEIIPEVWSVVGPEFERVRGGEAFAVDDWLVPLDRNGYLENCWFTLSYSPIRDESGGVGGLLAVVVETTGRVESERRLATLRALARSAAEAMTPEQACVNAAQVFGANSVDVPFALIYLLDREGVVARRVCAVGLAADHPANIEVADVASGSNDVWSLAEAVGSGTAIVHTELHRRFAGLPGGPYEEPTHTAVLLPLSRPGLDHPYGVLVVGVSPRRALDDRYRDFFDLAADHLATAISNAVALQEAKRRADALAEIDRAKTAFFSNVSHEFRTPLTLMLGPAAELLADAHGELSETQRVQVAILHRNAGRLLKLVNALLDFSRIEAGREQASYAQTDVASLTRELAGGFRSAIEHAGLRFDVHCDPIDDPVYVDRDMWEKIVLNLLSNAFKFTLAGSVGLELRQRDHLVELTVRDTGVGIPEAELPRVFERFHRVEGARSRTHEGSGIGLALTSELVRLHGGTITATSRADDGSVFIVRIPTGRAHLAADRVAAVRSLPSSTVGAAPFVDEAMRWLPQARASQEQAASVAGAPRERILVVDDNADMRDYLGHLLREWDVATATDGSAALEAARADPPELVVADVMMPGLDGLALLRELRNDRRTQAVPVLMLSARAGEEARVSGLAAGADDYVTKPFIARELIARVRSLLALTRARREAELQKQHLHSLFMQAPTPIAIFRGPDHVVELANPLTCQVWGRTEEEILGKPLVQAAPALDAQPFMALLDGVLRTGVTYVGKETPARLDRRGDGTFDTLYFNIVYAPLRGVDGGVEGILALAFDVTDEVTARDEMNSLRVVAEAARNELEMKVAERTAELRRSEAYLADAQRLTHTGSFAINVATREQTHSSDENSRLFGFEPKQGVPSLEQFLQRVHPDDRATCADAVEKGIRDPAHFEVEFRAVVPANPVKYLRAIAHPVFAASGELTEIVGTTIDVTERKRAEAERQAQLWFFESMDRINRAIPGTKDLEQMMGDVLDVVLATFGCDRAWLVYPCDPDVASHRVRMERTRPDSVGAFGLGVEIPNNPEVALVLRTLLAASGPVRFDPESGRALPAAAAERFSIASMMAMAVYPKVDKPYVFMLHQCGYARVWTPAEERLFQEIGRRLADALDTLLMLRDLRESERKLEEAQRIAHVGHWDNDLDTDRITWSDETWRIFGMAQRPTITLADVMERIHPDDRAVVTNALALALAGSPIVTMDYRVVLPHGEVRIIHSEGDVTRDESGRLRRVFGTVQDVTDRKRADQALEELAGRLIHAQEEERSRIGRELHDHISQRLGLLAIKIDQLRTDAGPAPTTARAIDDLRQSTDDIADDVHRLSHRLHSSTLDYLGLGPALRKLVGEFSTRHGIAIDLTEVSLPTPLASDAALCLFRIAEESLTNIAKHSHARSARVHVSGAADGVHLTVEDDGDGFDVRTLENKAGLGFVSMQERLRVLRGTVRVDSTASQGTRIAVWIPSTSVVSAPAAL